MSTNNKAINTKHEYEKKNKKLNIPKSYDINMEYYKNNDAETDAGFMTPSKYDEYIQNRIKT